MDFGEWFLYHGTLTKNVPSIMELGLGAKSENKTYQQSKPGMVYLAETASAARQWAQGELSNYSEDITVLRIDTSKLDHSRLDDDENMRISEECPECATPVLDRTNPVYKCLCCSYEFEGDISYQYEGVIPSSAISIETDKTAVKQP
jgi:ribosomal protein L37AE/L43A